MHPRVGFNRTWAPGVLGPWMGGKLSARGGVTLTCCESGFCAGGHYRRCRQTAKLERSLDRAMTSDSCAADVMTCHDRDSSFAAA